MRIKKRDGTYQQLEMAKVQRCILMAIQTGRERPDVGPLVHRVMECLTDIDSEYTVENVSDLVEEVLVDAGHVQVARAYMRYRVERDRVRALRLRPDSLMLPEYIHVAKYARYVDDLERRERYLETVARVEGMHKRRFPQLTEEITKVFSFVRRRDGMPSMRSMQFGGDAIVKDNARLYNCAFGHLSRWDAFREMFWLLLCGCGVGYSVQWRHIEQLSALKKIDKGDVCHYTIADTIQGWADALGFLLESYYKTGCYAEFDYSRIRSEGVPLKTSGGRAPGHLPLKSCLESVRKLLDNAQGRQLRPIEAHDIMCYAADAVLAGGIRRSSLLALFSPEDTEMMYCKSAGNFRPSGRNGDPGKNAQREMANNSAVLLRNSCDYKTFARVIRIAQEGFGDPGFYFTNNLDYGPNPCGEIGMWPMVGYCRLCEKYYLPEGDQCPECEGYSFEILSGISFCNLTEVNCVGADADELINRVKAMAFIGTLQSDYTDFGYLGPVTEAIVRRERLLGVGLAGIMDNRGLALDAKVLQRAAAAAVAENKRVAKLIGINSSARVTTVKPGGTAPLEMGGIGSGIHPRWARRYFHRVTANPLEPQARYFREINPHMVETKGNGDWCIVFPVECSDNAVTVKELKALDHLDDVMNVFNNWIVPGTADVNSSPGLTHNVSCTLTVRDGELAELIDRIWEKRSSIAAMTFVPYTLDAKFDYAPREAVKDASEDRWNRLIRLYKPVDWSAFKETVDSTKLIGAAACAGGSCEL